MPYNASQFHLLILTDIYCCQVSLKKRKSQVIINIISNNSLNKAIPLFEPVSKPKNSED